VTTVYALRHGATGTLMPEMKNRKGYSHWSPGQPGGIPDVATNMPRLFPSRTSAVLARSQWVRGPVTVTMVAHGGWDEMPYDEPELTAKDVGRKTADLNLVEFELREVAHA
jgi:hypothetical protein